MAVHATPVTAGSSGSQPRGAAAAAQTPLDSLPFLSRLARSASNLSASSTGSPAAWARGGAANLPPASSAQGSQQQLLHTPVFGSRRRSAGMVVLPVSPGFGTVSGGGSAGLRARSPLAAVAGRDDARDRTDGVRRLSAPTGYSESGISGESLYMLCLCSQKAFYDAAACALSGCVGKLGQEMQPVLQRASGTADAAAPSFSMQAPSGLSSDEEDEADSAAAGAASRRRR